YTKEDHRQPYHYFPDPLMELTYSFCHKSNLPVPAVVIEPGRSSVAEAGISLHTNGNIKALPQIRKYAAMDGGMTDNIRPGLYQAVYSGLLANKAGLKASEKITIAGKA